MPGQFQIMVGKGYRLTLPTSVIAAHAPGLELVATAAPGGDGTGASHWRFYTPDAFEKVFLPACAASPSLDVLRAVSSASWLTVTKARRLTLPASFRGLGLVVYRRPPFPAVLVTLPTHFELWPRETWSRDLEQAMRLPAALAGLDFDD